MKKFLSIMLTVLMIVTMIPFAPLTMAADTVTVYLKNDAGWRSTVYAYCWKDNSSVRPLGSWPGTLMDEVEGESQLYAIDVPTDIYAIIFSDGGINQTPDLFLPADGSNYYNNATGEWTTISTRGHDHALTAGGEALEFTTLPADTTLIDTAGNYYLTQDIELTDNLWINVEGTVNLCLNGHSITAVEEGGNPVVVILKAGTLNLCDCQGGGCITSAEDLTFSGVRTLADTEFNMYSGEIKNNYYYAVECIDFNMYGGKLSGNKQAAVDVKGAFNMYGGEISGNSGEWGTVSVGNNGSFTMYDGEIKDNINKSTYWNSGTVYVQKGIFTMKGGKITGNTGGSGTGGVHTYGNFVMDGGEISGNSGNSGGVSVGIDGVFTMNGGKISGNKSNLGGGVYINERASFNMNGGEISGNTAEQGGGVFSTYDSAKINLKKGVITGNSATYAGGVGAQYANTPVEISGADVQIVNNTAPNYPDLRANAPVIVSAPLDSAKTKISLSVNGGIIAKPDGTNLTTLEGMEDCFIVSEEDGFIKCNEKGELELTEWNASISEKDGDFVVEAPHNGAYTITYQWYELNGDELTELEGETSDKLTADKIVIGKTYACKIYLDGEEKEMLTIGCSYAITHQPTVAEPYVELNDDTDASYQWYTVEDGITEVTDENADTVAYDWGESSYDKETGWTGVSYEEGGTEYDFFTVELEAGETITVEVTGDFIDGLGLWDYDTENYAWVDSEEYVTSYELTVELEGNYTFYTYVNSGVVTVKAFKTAFDKIAIEGEISAELKNPEFGKKYACEVTFADDTTEMSDAFEYKYAITHQPTAAEPYVELNDDTDATYCWYAVEGDMVEFTNENANPIDYYDGPTEYDPETGWNADFWSETGGYFFYVYLEEGEKITVEFNHPVYDEVGIWGYYEDDGDYSYLNGETTVSLVAPFSDYFDIYAYGINADTRVKAYIDNRIYTEIEGQTTATLTPTALGRYACEVTFVDGTTEMSEAFEVTTLHTCDFTGEWKYDSEKHWKECTADGCSKISEEAEHSFTDGKCSCGYACPHDSYTDGVCDNCEYACPHENVTGATCRTPVECDVCGYSVFDWTNHEGEYVTVWFNDYQHVSEYECCHIESSVVYEDHKYENYTVTTPADCVNNAWETGTCICGGTHVREIADSATDHNWSNKDGICANGCGETCPHEKYTDGVCDKCDYECPHEWGEGILTRPVYDAVLGSKDGYYTFTCTLCGEEKTETVKSADYSAYEAVSEEINGLLQSDDLTPEAKQAIYSAANECGLLSNDLMESEQNIVDDLVAELEKIVADAEEKIASGEYVKADYTAIDEAIADIEQKFVDKNITDEGKADLDEIKAQLEAMKADGNTSEADLAELEKALEDYEEELDEGIEDGTLVEFSGERVFLELAEEAEKKIDEKHGEDAFYNFANANRDSFYNLYDKYFFRAAALEGGTMAENAENIEYIKKMVDELFGMAENCIDGTHNYGKGVLTRPTFETEGYYTYTCTLCGHSYTEPAEKADTTALNDASMKVTEYIDNDTLTQEAKDEIYNSYRDILKNNRNIFDELGFVRGDLVEEDQPAINAVTAELEKIIADAEEKIASGEYVKINGLEEIVKINDKLNEELAEKYGEEALAEITDKIDGKYDEEFDELYEKAEALTGSVAENKEALEEIEAEMEAIFAEIEKCLAGTHSFTDYYIVIYADCVNNAWEEGTCSLCGETDEREIPDSAYGHTPAWWWEKTETEHYKHCINDCCDDEIEGTRGHHVYENYEITKAAACGVNAEETGTCICGMTHTREVEGTALTHSFTKYEETEAPKCGVAGKKTACCDHGCGATDEKEIEALTHVFDKFVSNGDATCTADGTKTASCIHGCGAEETVTDEGTKLDHADEDGDDICDDCEAEIIDVCPDCGRPVHENEGIPHYICIIIMFLRLVVSLVKALQGIA